MPVTLLVLSWALQLNVEAPNLFAGQPSAPAAVEPALQSVAAAPSIAENRGQFGSEAQLGLHARDRSIFFTSSGVTIALRDGSHFELGFAGGDGLQWNGHEASATRHNYVGGEQDDWLLNVHTWKSVRTDLGAGLELEFRVDGNRLKYAFHVAPGASVDELTVHYRNCDALELAADGGLHIRKGESLLEDAAPLAWQHGESQQMVDVRFDVDANTRSARLVVGDYDPQLPLVVDPEVLLLCGFIGGALEEQCRGIDVDDNGNIFVAGFAQSPDLPVSNAFQPGFGGGESDVWVAKITPNSTIAFLTYLGGTGKELAYDCSVGDDGAVYIAGGTTSADFPYLNGPSSGNNGSLDCFVTKLANDGTPVYSGTFGGTEFDSLRGNYVDAAGNHYVIGRSFTWDGSFPVVGGPLLSHSGGISDAILARISPDGSNLVFAGFLGGVEVDYGRDIIADSDGNVYACGWTNSDESTFPVTVGPDLTHNGGAKDYGLGWEQYGDAWVTKFSPDGTTFAYCGFIGGARADAAFGLALDDKNRLYTAGHTTSEEDTFPVKVGPLLEFQGNGNPDANPYGDGWVARVNAAGTDLDFCGYVGGTGPDRAWRMNRSDLDGAIYLVGVTSSDEETLQHLNAGARSYRSGSSDAWLARVDGNGRWVDYTSLFAGEMQEVIRDVCIGPDNRVHLAGWAESGVDFPQITPGWTFSGGTDAFIASLPAFHQLLRTGNRWPDTGTGLREDLLTVNGQAGTDTRREINLMAGVPVSIHMDSTDGSTQPYALYMIPREAAPDDVFHIEYQQVEYGTSVFPMPAVFNSDPTLVTMVNSYGLSYFGIPLMQNNPMSPGAFTWVPPSSGAYTLQAIVPDATKPTGYTLSNAVVLRVH